MTDLDTTGWAAMKKLSPRRNSTRAQNHEQLVDEQLAHFGLDEQSEYGRTVASIARKLYETGADLDQLWRVTVESLQSLDRSDRIAYFNAKKFLTFQIAKLLDSLQMPFRRTYQTLELTYQTQSAKGPYSIFDNVTAIFSATPVVARTATYIYACAEWIEDAFKGKELLLEIYSRLLNPTSIALANFIVDLEAGPYASEYFAWNFNSGMAAIDGVLSHLLGRQDVLISSRNIYGGSHQLIHDWYAKPANLDIGVVTFDGYGVADFTSGLAAARQQFAHRFAQGRKAYLYLESPCNPHGYVLDLPGICESAHQEGLRVILDATVGTPFLVQSLQERSPTARPDFVIHSYTKDLSGTGQTIAGVAIGRNEDMFIPKGESAKGIAWNETLFWNVYYVKGAFLHADAAYEVIQGMRTLGVRMLQKCINTSILARFFDAHPEIRVHCNILPTDPNSTLREKLLLLGLPAPLFTIDMEGVPREAFQRFFDCLEPIFSHMISLGQSNTIVSCPALTTHSELDEAALTKSGICATTVRLAVGDEDPKDLIAHFVHAARLAFDPIVPGYSDRFPLASEIDAMVREVYLAAHDRYIQAKRPFEDYVR